jgi:hypothetical protein
MISSFSFAVLFVALSLTFESATPATARPLRGRDSNSYIVKLKEGANTTSHINSLPFPFSVNDTNSPITHWWPDDFFKGYSGIFVGAALDAILASPDVKYVEKNGVVRLLALSLPSRILNHTHRSGQLLQIHKPTHRGISKPSAPNGLSAAQTCTQ